MAKKAKKTKTKQGLKLEIVNPNAAGIDVSSREMQVCVPQDRDEDSNRCFGTFTEDLHSISSWLKSCNIDTVAMESTGVYWVQLYMILEADGFDVLMVNAKAIKNIGEKKTDEVDAEWIMLLHSYGLLKASFQPDNYARRIRNLSRHRDNLVRAACREIQHIQKAMELMNIKLTNVISDIMGKSGQSIISAIIAGERNAFILASLADGRCKSSKEVIEKSLVANWDEDLLFMLQQSFELYHYLQNQMKECDKKIELILKEYIAILPQENQLKECPRADKAKFFNQKEKLNINSALRTIFSIIFLIPLFNKILRFAKEKGYNDTYPSILLFVGFFVVNFLAYLPDPFWLIAILGFVFFVLPFRALNFAKRNSSDFIVTEQTSYSGRQIALIVIGGIIWVLVIFGLIVPN